MAALYVFEGIDARKQEASAEKYAASGFATVIHYHHAWAEDQTRIPCNDQCHTVVPKEEE